MFNFVDKFLNNITMYRLVLYFLIILSVVGLVYSFLGILPYNPVGYIFSFLSILVVSLSMNFVFSKVFEAPINVESTYITALILAFIVAPPKDIPEMIFIFWASVLAVSSKYILAIGKKHVFNPVAISVLITYFFLENAANWWVGTLSFLPWVAIGSFLIIRKIRRWDLALSFIFFSLGTIAFYALQNDSNPFDLIKRGITNTGLLFFAGIMLIEPLTTPPTKILRLTYGALVGILFAPQFNIAGYYLTPEIALVIGNVFSYLVSPKYKLLLTLREKIKLSPDTYDFVFNLPRKIKFTPGQYMEFTFDHPDPDSRGNRRYLSLASSPTEQEIRLGIKFGDPPSSFKKNLLNLTTDQKVVASQLIGDFVLPKDIRRKLVLIAGGIGITPYRSILKYLLDTGERRDIVVVYTASGKDRFVYNDILKEAEEKLGVKTIFIDTKKERHIERELMVKKIPDYKDRIFYISGSLKMVTAFERIVRSLGISKRQVVTDYFPGFA